MDIINFKNIYISYDIEPILEELNLIIKENQHWAILGANGSGKSSLIKLISNDIYPNTKYNFTKKVFGQDRWSIFDLKKKLGIITNDLHNYFEIHGSFLTVYEVIISGYFSSIGVFKHQDFTNEQHDKAKEVLNFLELEEIKEKRVCKLSTGQLRKALIGRALIHEPKAFILDEPTVGLDFKAQFNFIKTLKKLSRKVTIILVTHHIEEIFEEITHIALLKDKKIYKQGLKEDVLTSQNMSLVFDIKIELNKENKRYYIKSIKEDK